MDYKSTKWYVSYKVPSMSGDELQIAGPYSSNIVAAVQAADIRSFEGVTDCKAYTENADELLEVKLATVD